MKRAHGPAAPPARTPALIVAVSSLLLSTGLAATLTVWTDSLGHELAGDADGVDWDELSVVAWWAGDAALRWAMVSAAGSLAGVVGLCLGKSRLHRIFAITTATDLLVNVCLAMVLSLLTYSPSLSEPFGNFVCSSTFASELTTSSAAHLSWLSGAAPLELPPLWGLDACEETWQLAMLGVLLGMLVAIVLRTYGTWVSWEANSELRERELRDQGDAWVSDDDAARGRDADEGGCGGDAERKTPLALEATLGRPRAGSAASCSSSPRRSQTLPRPLALDLPATSSKRTRAQTVAYGQEMASTARRRDDGAQLVFVPVVLDERGQPVFHSHSPTYAAFPHFASPPRSCANTGDALPPPLSSRTKRPRPPRLRSSSSSASASSSSSSTTLAPSLFVDEPAELSPPCTPTGSSTSTLVADDKTSRRLRTRSEDVGLMSPPPP
ncbi:uncharacterized protein JCM10292_000149 [Rhodotorula paludigena]|uniref:uncharacterized protein n=1 Tax=Rhodotorula paludigena TaxID=86838 RepID=UPI0031709AC7